MQDETDNSRPSLNAVPTNVVASLKSAISILEAVVNDRSLMACLDEEDRRRLVMAAGRAAKPDQFQVKKMIKAMRRDKRKNDRSFDIATKSDADSSCLYSSGADF